MTSRLLALVNKTTDKPLLTPSHCSTAFWLLGLLALWLQASSAAAQVRNSLNEPLPAPLASRLAPGLARQITARPSSTSRQALRVRVTDAATFTTWLAQALPDVQTQLQSQTTQIFGLRNVAPDALAQLLASPLVVFVDQPDRPAHDERLLNQADLTINAITAVHRHYPRLTGRGLTVSVKENPIDPLDIDFRGRLLGVKPNAVVESAHASIMATLIAGAGNSGPAGQGAAREAHLISHGYDNLLPEPDAELTQLGVSVQNHSYGTGIENYYGLEAQEYDRQVLALPTLLHVFSSGNSGLLASPDGPYQGIPAVANLTGQFKMSKNSLSVGAAGALGRVAPQSSRGPAYDGRIKPELVAYGDAGTSDASALVSGSSLLVQQAYRDLHAGELPPAALVKAVLLNSANDVGRPEVDFESGFGQADALGAVRTMLEGHFYTGQLRQAEAQTIELNIPPGTEQLKLTLAWTDAPAAANAPQALVNDLDIELLGPAPGMRWLPWTLSSYPHPDSLALPARRHADHLNNVEQITLRHPVPGTYRLRMQGFKVSTNTAQDFSVAYEIVAPVLEWLAPNLTRNVLPAQPTPLRWQWPGETQLGQFDWRPLGQAAWRTIVSDVELAAKTLTWTPPDTTTLAQLRCVAAGREFLSDTFAIARPQRLRAGYVCETGALLTWPAVPGATAYQVYRLGATFLEPLQQTTDTLLALPPATAAALYFAVAPQLAGHLIERSRTINLAEAGLNCYISSFLPRASVADTVRLDLSLGTLYQLQFIRLQRFQPSDDTFQTIQTVQPVSQANFTFTDLAATPGLNQYRIWGQDAAGHNFYSLIETVQVARRGRLLVFPVPVVAGEALHVAGEPGQTLRLRLYDPLGRLIREATRNGALNEFPTTGLLPGMYILHAQPDAGPAVARRIIVL